MFIWTTGMPLFGLVFFAAVFFVAIYSFYSYVRGHEVDWDGTARRGRRRMSARYAAGAHGWRCDASNCQTINEARARFCRMCGRRRGEDGSTQRRGGRA